MPGDVPPYLHALRPSTGLKTALERILLSSAGIPRLRGLMPCSRCRGLYHALLAPATRRGHSHRNEHTHRKIAFVAGECLSVYQSVVGCLKRCCHTGFHHLSTSAHTFGAAPVAVRHPLRALLSTSFKSLKTSPSGGFATIQPEGHFRFCLNAVYMRVSEIVPYLPIRHSQHLSNLGLRQSLGA